MTVISLPVTRRVAFFIAGAAGLLGIAFGAFGAHALRGVLEMRHMQGIWNTAVFYHLIHASVLLWAATSEPFLQGAFLCWSLGILLFSGSLYALALTGIHGIGMVTPVGGIFLMVGWLIVALRAFQTPPSRP